MTIAEAYAAVQHIREIAGDDEVAHGREDDLLKAFAEHVRDNPTDSINGALATIVLQTQEIDFERWCA